MATDLMATDLMATDLMATEIVLKNKVLLSGLTTFEVGGPVESLFEVRRKEDVGEALAFARERKRRLFPLGGGSNVLASDRGFRGVLLRFLDAEVSIDSSGEGRWVRVRVGAGLELDRLVEFAVSESLAGLESLSGIPGTAGAAVVQNAGAYGRELADFLETVEVISLETGERVRVRACDCGFGYRRSRFKGPWRNRFLVTELEFRLERSPVSTVRYGELSELLGGKGPFPITEIREAVLELRRRKSMVLDPSDENRRSAGSFFVNPVRPAAEIARLASLLGVGAHRVPAFPVGAGRVKLSAAFLIERAGFRRGLRRGRVGISTRHALCIVNLGGAKASEIVRLGAEIQERVRERFGVTLLPEPVFLGFEEDEIPLRLS